MNVLNKDMATRMFSTALLKLAEIYWKQPSYPTLGGEFGKIHT